MTTAIQDINAIVQENSPAQKIFIYGLNESGNPELAKVVDGALKTSGGGSGTTVATVDNIVMQDTDGTLFFKRVTSDTPPVLTNWKLSDGTAYTITGSPVPYIVATTNVTGNVEITNDVGNKIPVADADLAASIGEVQANPTANTVLDRLKTLAALFPTALSNGFFKTSIQEWQVGVVGAFKIDQTTDGTTNLVRTKNTLTTLSSSGSGTITAGGTAQTVIAADAAGYHYAFQNLSATDMYISTVGTAAAANPSLKIVSGGYYETPDSLYASGALSVFGATTGQEFSVRKW